MRRLNVALRNSTVSFAGSTSAVLARADPALPAPPDPAAAPAADAPDGFLQRLLRRELPPEPAEEEQVSQELKKRCTFTSNVLQQVAAALAKKEEAAPAAEKPLRTKLDEWQHKATQAAEQSKALEGRVGLTQQQLRELQQKLDSTEDELEAAQRKAKNLGFALQDAKRDADSSKGASAAAAAAGGAAAAAAAPANSAASDARVEEAEEAQKTAEQSAADRLRESETLREQLTKSEQETLRLKQQLLEPDQEVVLKQPTYQCLAFEHAELYKNNTKLQEDYNQLQKELKDSTAASKSKAAKIAAATSTSRQELVSQLQVNQKELSSVRTRLEEAQDAMKRHQHQPDRAMQVTELNKLVSTLRKQVEQLQKDIKRQANRDCAKRTHARLANPSLHAQPAPNLRDRGDSAGPADPRGGADEAAEGHRNEALVAACQQEEG